MNTTLRYLAVFLVTLCASAQNYVRNVDDITTLRLVDPVSINPVRYIPNLGLYNPTVSAVVESPPQSVRSTYNAAYLWVRDDSFSAAGTVSSGLTLSTTAPLTGGGDLSANRTFGITLGSTAGTAAAGDDARFLSTVQLSDLTDAGDSTAHYHAADRARAVHTGTQLASTISDFNSAAALSIAGDRGPINTGGDGLTWTVDDNSVALSKLANATGPGKLLGRWNSGAGAWEPVTIASGLALDGAGNLTATGSGGVPAGGATGYVLAKATAADYDLNWVPNGSGGGGGYSSLQDLTVLGAIGNDSFDNTAVFAAAAAAGGSYILPYGTYRMDAVLFSKGFTVYALRDPTTGAYATLKCRTAITGNNAFFKFTGNYKYELRNVRFLGNGVAPSAVSYALLCDDNAEVDLHNVTFEGWSSTSDFAALRTQNPSNRLKFRSSNLSFTNIHCSGITAAQGRSYGIWFHTYQNAGANAALTNYYKIDGASFSGITALTNTYGGDNMGVARGIDVMGGGRFDFSGLYFHNIESVTTGGVPYAEDADCISLASSSEQLQNVTIRNVVFDRVAKRGLKSQMDNPDSVVSLENFTFESSHATTGFASYAVVSTYGGHVSVRDGYVFGAGKILEFSDVGGEFRSLHIERVWMNAGKCLEGESYVVGAAINASTFGFISSISNWHKDAVVTVDDCDIWTGARTFSFKRGGRFNISNSRVYNTDTGSVNANLISLSGDSTETTLPGSINVINCELTGFAHLIRSTIAGGRYDIKLTGNTFRNAYAQVITSVTRSGGTVTVTTETPHLLTTGNTAIIRGMDQADYNVAATVTVTSPTVFTFTTGATPTTPGTFTWQATARKDMDNYVVGSILSKAIQSAIATGNRFYDFDQGGYFSNAPWVKTEAGNQLIRATTTTIW